MLSDSVGTGSFHHVIKIIGGTIATTTRTAQPESECRFPAIPATQITETQAIASTVLIEIGSMQAAYPRGVIGAVPECTHNGA